jgi:AraC-like DNA-binding protein
MMNGAIPERALRMECAVARMKEDLAAALPLSDLARSVPFSRFHFLRLFRTVTGLTPGRFLAALRMAEARRLLLHSSLAVGVIGPQVGYTSVGTFTTQFTRLVGLSPEQFRKLVRSVARLPWPALPPVAASGSGPVVCPETWRPGDRMVVAWRAASGSTSVESCLTAAPGPVTVPLPHDGRRYQVRLFLAAAGVRPTEALVDQEPGGYLVSTLDRTLTATTRTTEPLRMTPRRPLATDPPLLPATPLIQMGRWSENLERPA